MERAFLREDVVVVVEQVGVVARMLVVNLILLQHEVVDVADAAFVVQNFPNDAPDIDGQDVTAILAIDGVSIDVLNLSVFVVVEVVAQFFRVDVQHVYQSTL